MSKANLVIANTLNLDYESSRAFENEYRYQPSLHKAAIYTNGADYYAATKAAPKDVVGKPWVKWPDQFWAQKSGLIMWVSTVR